MEDAPETDVVMQPRCVFCKAEQYVPAVYDISHGRHWCVWCGRVPPVFTDEVEYHAALKASKSEARRPFRVCLGKERSMNKWWAWSLGAACLTGLATWMVLRSKRRVIVVDDDDQET